jgi:hypothetical protein
LHDVTLTTVENRFGEKGFTVEKKFIVARGFIPDGCAAAPLFFQGRYAPHRG